MGMMPMNIFKKIVDGEIPADIVYQDDRCLAFRDIHPQAPTHILIIPKEVIRMHSDLAPAHDLLLGHLHLVAKKLAQDLGHDSYRLVINCNEEAGQTVPHLHLHLLAGRPFDWPPG